MNVSLDDAGLADPEVPYHQHLVQVLLFPCCGCLETEGGEGVGR